MDPETGLTVSLFNPRTQVILWISMIRIDSFHGRDYNRGLPA